MSDKKSVECKCEKCLQPIDDSSDVKSLGEYDIICESCISSYDECSGYNCSEIGTDFTVSSNGDHYCRSCEDSLVCCYQCEELVDSNQYSIYEWSGDSYCQDCANDDYAYECSCGCGVSISTAVGYEDYDFVINEMCEECYERHGQKSHIDSATETSIDKSILEGAYIQQRSFNNTLTEAKRKDFDSFSQFFNRFYGYFGDDYEKQKLIIRKGAFGYERWGWFETSVEIQSELNNKIYKMLDYLICDNSDSLYRPHRKYGRYQPFAFAFSKLCEFYISSDRKNEDGESLYEGDERYVKRRYPSLESSEHMNWIRERIESSEQERVKRDIWEDIELDGFVWLKYYVDHIDRAKLKACVKSRKMPDGKCLLKTINKLIAQHVKSADQFRELDESNEESDAYIKYTAHPLAPTRYDKITSSYKIRSCWDVFGYKSYWEKYCTNSISVTVPARIGFDAQAHENVVAFNDDIGACQGSSYRATLGFNHISMSSNPHLYLIFYDPDDESSIIGRIVIRLLWEKSKPKLGYGEPLKKTLYIAPSRLYLKGYTHAKNQFYAGAYKALNQWKDIIAERLGAEEVKMIAYERTRHDSYSMKDYVTNAYDPMVSVITPERNPESDGYMSGRFTTDWFYPIFLEKPTEEAYWGYYPDEYQGYESAYVDSSAYSSYATRETYNGQYSYIEVKNE